MQGMSLDQLLTFAPLDGCIGITRVTTLLYFESSRVAWQDARQACQRIRGGDLVSIHSAAENDCIERHISGPCWIGLNDLRTEGNFQWSDGSSSVYKSYSNNEPNDFHGQEDCVEIRPWLAGSWNYLNCSINLCYVCKQTKKLPTVCQLICKTYHIFG